MGFLGTIIYVTLLLLNATAILSEERFLARIGWSTLSPHSTSSSNIGFGTVPTTYSTSDNNNNNNNGGIGPGGIKLDQEGPGVKGRLIGLIAAVRTLMRIPLIVANVVIIVYELILG